MRTAVVAVDVRAGDVLCPALDTEAPEKLTRGTLAALHAGTMVTGVAATTMAAGGTVNYYAQPEVVPAGVAGLGAGPPSAVVADAQGRCARQLPVVEGAFVVGECDARGNVTVAPKHDFANVLDFGARGDDQSDDWDAITRAMRSLHPLQPGVVYFPAGYYRVSRPLVVDRERGQIELLGESEHTTTVRFFAGHGPALCVSPRSLGHLPTGTRCAPGRAGPVPSARATGAPSTSATARRSTTWTARRPSPSRARYAPRRSRSGAVSRSSRVRGGDWTASRRPARSASSSAVRRDRSRSVPPLG